MTKRDATPLQNLCSLSVIPIDGETVDCSSCGRTCDARMVRQCKTRGPNPQPAAKPARHDPVASDGCCGKSPKPVKVQRPGWFKKATTYATAMAKYVVDGRQERSPEEQAANLAICSTCPLLGKDGSCDGCGCVVEPWARVKRLPTKIEARLESCPAGKWFEDVRPAKPLVNPVRNLIYHLLPTTLHDGWKRNLDELAKRWSVFNGRKYLSVVTTDGGINNTRNGAALKTVPSLDVMAYCEHLGITWTEVRQVTNNGKLGEVVSLPWLLDAVMNDNQNEVTFYGHSKGTSRPQGATLDHWRDSMYHYCLDDMASVDRALERFSCAASLLRNDPMSANKWHPSGTFFWFRNADLFAKDWRAIQQSYHGAEAYIGDHFQRHEVAALAHSNMGNLYVHAEWDRHNRASEVWDAARAIQSEPVVIAKSPEPVKPPPKVIALYLPAFHRDPINDRAWGPGWTEWDNLRRWKPIKPGHTIQRPHADIGEYDLLSTDARRKQAELANSHGVHGFAVYHYWFNGAKALHQPYELMLLDGEPDLPFHFVWANEPWTKRWDGRDSEVIQAQTYGGRDEWRSHAEYLRPFVEHPNYITHDGRRVLGIYRPGTIPHLTERLTYYREVLGDDLHFATLYGTFGREQVPSNYPILDSAIEFAPHAAASGWEGFATLPHQRLFRGACPSWDNSPRRGTSAYIHSIQPFADQLHGLRNEDVIYVDSWNEWGEQAILEPSDRDGYARLKEIAAFTRR